VGFGNVTTALLGGFVNPGAHPDNPTCKSSAPTVSSGASRQLFPIVTFEK